MRHGCLVFLRADRTNALPVPAGRLLSAAGEGGADGRAFVLFLYYSPSTCPDLCAAYSAALCDPAYPCPINSARDVRCRHCKKQSEQADGKLAKPAYSSVRDDYALHDDALFSGIAERNGGDSGGNQSTRIVSALA